MPPVSLLGPQGPPIQGPARRFRWPSEQGRLTATNLVTPQSAFPHVMGCLINAVADPSNFTLSAANSWCALSFVLSENKYLSEVRGFCNGVLGSMGVNDATCTIYSDLWGAPGVALDRAGRISTTLATGFRSWTGFSLSITAGVKYWAVWKNVNGTPGSNTNLI